MTELPGIRKAALEIAYDNGKINRYHPEDVFIKDFEGLLDAKRMMFVDIGACDAWLLALSADEMMTVCGGEETEAAALMSNAPESKTLNDLLNDIFEL